MGGAIAAVIMGVVVHACVPCATPTPTSGDLDIHPGESIASALKTVTPGDTLTIHEGTYSEYLTTSVNGTEGNPITIKGEGNVVLKGKGDEGRLVQVMHDWYIIEGLTFINADKLLWLQESDHTIIRHNTFDKAYGECVRIKYLSSDNLFENNTVKNCGVGSFVKKDGGKNGEGVYIGTAPEQLDKNPTKVRDASNSNTVTHNTFNTQGNECVDIKEGASFNVVSENDCTGQKDTESAGFDSRGSENSFISNKSYGNLGAGIRFGGDKSSDGIKNSAMNNELHDNKGYAIKVMRTPQGVICGNTAANNAKGFSNEKLPNPPC